MKTIIVIFLILFLNTLNSQVLWQVKSTTATKWFLQDCDEFSNDAIDTKMWKSGLPWGNYVYNLDFMYKAENITFSNGVASIITKKINEPLPIVNEYLDKEYMKTHNQPANANGDYTYQYTGGALTSNKWYKYGYFEMRFKANAERGMWPAFWLFGGNPSEEIDFYEGKGDRENQIHLDMHCDKGCDDFKGGFLNLKKNWGAWVKTDKSLADGWNIISGEWQPDYVKIFLNGQPIGYFGGSFKQAKNLIVNSAVAKNDDAFNPGPNEKTVFPNEFLVDYVRVWSQEDTVSQTKDNYKLFESSVNSITNNDLYYSKPKGKVNFIYNKKALDNERGTITLLPIFYNKYSLSFAGKSFGKVNVDVFDTTEKKVSSFNLENEEFYILDLSALQSGKYKVVIDVFNQKLTHDILIKNPKR
jgi:beta-glucanase (GH16 family)